MILACQKLLGQITKVLGFGETPPPRMGKTPKKSRIFFLTGSLKSKKSEASWLSGLICSVLCCWSSKRLKKGEKEEEVVEEFDKYVSPQMNIQGSWLSARFYCIVKGLNILRPKIFAADWRYTSLWKVKLFMFCRDYKLTIWINCRSTKAKVNHSSRPALYFQLILKIFWAQAERRLSDQKRKVGLIMRLIWLEIGSFKRWLGSCSIFQKFHQALQLQHWMR